MTGKSWDVIVHVAPGTQVSDFPTNKSGVERDVFRKGLSGWCNKSSVGPFTLESRRQFIRLAEKQRLFRRYIFREDQQRRVVRIRNCKQRCSIRHERESPAIQIARPVRTDADHLQVRQIRHRAG